MPDDRKNSILMKPLPDLFEELWLALDKVEAAIRRADEAAETARAAGIQAGKVAEATAKEQVAKAREEMNAALGQVKGDITALRGDMIKHVIADEKAIRLRHDVFIAESPFFEKTAEKNPDKKGKT